jgi:hypothetical protein
VRIGSRSVARVEVADDEVRVIPVGLAKMWSVRRVVRIPVARIKTVELFADEDDEFRGRVKTGRFRASGVTAFLVVGAGRPVVVIECPGRPFDRVVFSAEDPEAAVRDISGVLPSHLP